MQETSQSLQAKREKFTAKAVFQLTKIAIKKAKGAKIWDVEGNEYIDFVGGIGCVNAGHNPDKVISAIKEQLEQYIHPGFNIVNYQPYIELAEKLCHITPGHYDKQAILFNSGAEAVENAIKVARYATKRSGVICFDSGYHGRTLLTMSLTSKVNPYKLGYGPFAPEIYCVPHPAIDQIENYEQYWESIFTNTVAAEQVSAIIFEPELGEGGFIPMPYDFIQHLRKLCDQKGIIMIADEVQTGFCRTGKLFAMEHYKVSPDIIVLGKSIASGLPLSAIVGKKTLMAESHVGGLGGTYSGNPLACASALATIKIYEDEHLADRALVIGELTKAFFFRMKKEYKCISAIRGLGAMIGIEFVNANGEADATILKSIIEKSLQNGVILMSSGTKGNVLRTLMPLVISDEELQTAFDKIENAFKLCVIK